MKCAICRQDRFFNQKLFIEATIKCGICLETKDASEFMLANCGHAFCNQCLNPEPAVIDNRNNGFPAIVWLATYEPNTMIISRHWMNTDGWPQHVIEHIDQNWTKYPQDTDIWPETAIYYKCV